jgi:hypothetical protein
LISGEITASFNALHANITPGEEDVWINIHPFDLSKLDEFPEFNFEITPEIENSDDSVQADQENYRIIIAKEALQHGTNYIVSVSVNQEADCSQECTFTTEI